MTTTRLLVLAAVAAAAASLAAAAASAGTPTLVGTVGPGFTISLKQNGKPVTALKAGTYTFVISDKATIHAFSLTGPHGFAKAFTTVPFTGTKRATVKLAAGSYTYFCPPHRAFMSHRFTVK